MEKKNYILFTLILFYLKNIDSSSIINSSNTNYETKNETINVDESKPGLTMDFKCLVCHWGANILVNYAKNNNNRNSFLGFVSTMCHMFGIESKHVCRSMVSSVGNQLFYIISQGREISGTDICGLVEEGKCAKYSQRMNNWGLNITDLENTSPVSNPIAPIPGKPKQKILHLTDPHVQRDYQIGARTNCGEPMCCSALNGFPKDKKYAASFYGDYHCDIPPWILDSMVKKIHEEHPDIDYVFITGDLPAHDVWRQNKTLNIHSAEIVVDVLKKYFKDIPVFPAIGNHESYPVNMFPQPNVTSSKYDSKWLYTKMANLFNNWITGEEQQKTFSIGGFYTQLLRPGLRIVSINTNVCNNLNFFLLLDFNDPWNHLHWLYRVLSKSESNKESVYIIGHIPPGRNDCFNHWSHEFGRLIRRFNNTILGQFYGHTHLDEFEVFFKDSPEPIAVNVAYLAPALTTFHGLNPSYRIYEIDGNHDETTNLILDHTTYYFDLKESIDQDKLVHKKEYSAKKDLGLNSLSPHDWENFVYELVRNETKFQLYYDYYYHEGPSKTDPCNKKCKKKILCHLLTSESGNDSYCKKLFQLLDDTHVNSISYFWSFF